MSFSAFSQISVKEGSFHKIQGFVMTDKNDHYDDNDRPMALIKITTENIKAEQRVRFIFKGNAATYFDVQQKEGETYLYLSIAATFLEIIHPDYGKTEYWLPEDLCAFCAYELVVVRKGGDDEDEAPNINYLIISSDQDNASIYIDGDYVGDKEASRAFEIGTKHSWKIECKLYHTESGEVTIGNEAVEINKTLRPAYGFINVTSMPESNAVVFINGERVGTTPYTSDRMASGTYKVKVMKEMYEAVEQTVVIKDGETTLTDINMSANFLTLNVSAEAGSDIYLDNEFKAKGKWTGRVPLGSHYFEARKENHKPSVTKVDIKKGDNTDIVLENPQPINGHIDINSSPMKADIYIDGKHYGSTPKIITNILIGNHKLRLEKEGCATLTKDILVEEGKTLSLNEKLSTGKEIVIKTDKAGDKVYVDDKYIGDTPLTTNLSFGKHSIKALRGSQTATKNVEVKIDNNVEAQEYVLVFGKMVTINSNAKGDDIYVDGVKVGQTPMNVDFTLGKHEVMVKRGKLYETKDININKNSQNSYNFTPRQEPLKKYLDRGVKFITLNAAYSVAPQTSLGLTFGSVKKVGWFVSAMTGLDFTAFDVIDTPYKEVVLTGESKSSRISVTGGVVARLGGPVYVKAGAGYGMRVRCLQARDGSYVEYPNDTYKGIDMTAGLQFNLRNITFGIDAVTTNFKYMELKLGIGVNFN